MMRQLTDAEKIVRRIERDADAASEIYQDLCLVCLSQDIDWSVPQQGRIGLIARRLRVTRYRRARVRRSRTIDWAEPHEFAIPDRARPVDNDLLARLTEALRRLPSRQRMAVEHHYLCGKSDDTLAVEMRVNVTTIRQWRSRGLKSLRMSLGTAN